MLIFSFVFPSGEGIWLLLLQLLLHYIVSYVQKKLCQNEAEKVELLRLWQLFTMQKGKIIGRRWSQTGKVATLLRSLKDISSGHIFSDTGSF
jgi:hypothetical protein